MRVATQIGRFFKAPDRDVRVIDVEHLRGGRGREVFYTTDRYGDIETVLARYSWRWPSDLFAKTKTTRTGATSCTATTWRRPSIRDFAVRATDSLLR